jgi:hypothetical protein
MRFDCALQDATQIRIERDEREGYRNGAKNFFIERWRSSFSNMRATKLKALVAANVRAKRAPAAGRLAPDGENVPRTASRGQVACRWRSA